MCVLTRAGILCTNFDSRGPVARAHRRCHDSDGNTSAWRSFHCSDQPIAALKEEGEVLIPHSCIASLCARADFGVGIGRGATRALHFPWQCMWSRVEYEVLDRTEAPH